MNLYRVKFNIKAHPVRYIHAQDINQAMTWAEKRFNRDLCGQPFLWVKSVTLEQNLGGQKDVGFLMAPQAE